jgi:hypothetical protein
VDGAVRDQLDVQCWASRSLVRRELESVKRAHSCTQRVWSVVHVNNCKRHDWSGGVRTAQTVLTQLTIPVGLSCQRFKVNQGWATFAGYAPAAHRVSTVACREADRSTVGHVCCADTWVSSATQCCQRYRPCITNWNGAIVCRYRPWTRGEAVWACKAS